MYTASIVFILKLVTDKNKLNNAAISVHRSIYRCIDDGIPVFYTASVGKRVFKGNSRKEEQQDEYRCAPQ